ncbi:HigA family addiction module antitoxin [Arthrobacter sp. CAN_C5]|uniref:HigA family addiction module antitoxin n=1 Tax=Arthrobacter sp. CAN_C5 TaxID=2760706 RepID=UPI001AEA56A7|nr:HigA family addiction module antitoxin [Arthrobacter sp. CAN_C5]MBP2215107.1 HTH-type transcriptional regulator/antitoxin HigA [Arthrobacter sp. CAN_C5]
MAPELVEAFPPGDFLTEELEARHWSQNDFAQILGRPAQFVSEIISGKKEITRESAAQIGAAIGTGPEYWLNLQNSYLLWSQSQNDSIRKDLDDVRLRARMNELAPVSLLLKRGVLTGQSLAEQANELVDLFQIDHIEDTPRFLAAARRSNRDEGPTPTQKAWLACARKHAQRIQTSEYDPARLQRLAEQLSRLVLDPEKFATLPAVFSAVGVRLVYVEAFPGSKLNGASFLLDGDTQQPVIALSGRGKRLDMVLFTLLHEVAHLVLGHVSPERIVIDEESSDEPAEKAADEKAGQWQIPGGLPTPPLAVRRGWIESNAQRIGIHPVVVLGKLQRDKALDYRTAMAKGAPTVNTYLELWA